MAHRTRRRFLVPLAALQLVVQGLGGGVVAWVHGRERSSAPAAIEAQHGSACVVLHDALRCAACQLVGLRAMSEPGRARVASVSGPVFPAPADRTPATRIVSRPPARAPPASLS